MRSVLNLIDNTLALDIHAFSSKLLAEYQGDCSCTLDPYMSSHSCKPHNIPGSKPCVVIWWADMPNMDCKALVVLNIGNTSATIQVSFPSTLLGGSVGSKSKNVTNVYDKTSAIVSGSVEVTVVGQGDPLAR